MHLRQQHKERAQAMLMRQEMTTNQSALRAQVPVRSTQHKTRRTEFWETTYRYDNHHVTCCEQVERERKRQYFLDNAHSILVVIGREVIAESEVGFQVDYMEYFTSTDLQEFVSDAKSCCQHGNRELGIRTSQLFCPFTYYHVLRIFTNKIITPSILYQKFKFFYLCKYCHPSFMPMFFLWRNVDVEVEEFAN